MQNYSSCLISISSLYLLCIICLLFIHSNTFLVHFYTFLEVSKSDGGLTPSIFNTCLHILVSLKKQDYLNLWFLCVFIHICIFLYVFAYFIYFLYIFLIFWYNIGRVMGGGHLWRLPLTTYQFYIKQITIYRIYLLIYIYTYL